MESRIDEFRRLLPEAEIDGLLVTAAENRRYLSGFTGSAGYLIISATAALLATDFRYVEQAAQQSPAFAVRHLKFGLKAQFDALMAEGGIRRLGFEAANLSVAALDDLKPAADAAGVELVPVQGLVERLRIRKSAEELQLLEDAIAVADAAFQHAWDQLRPGMTERQVAWEIERHMREHGAESVSFELIVAAGQEAALPHHRPSDREIAPGEPVVIDIGAKVRGYCSDMTRTVCIGEPNEKFREIYSIVLEAQEKAEREIRPGMTGGDADAIARDYIADAGYGEMFGHSLGHGIGLLVHEPPWVRARGTDVLAPGMVFSIEPGIYLPEWGGVRIEDLVLMTEEGATVLTKAPKLDELRRIA